MNTENLLIGIINIVVISIVLGFAVANIPKAIEVENNFYKRPERTVKQGMITKTLPMFYYKGIEKELEDF